MCKKLKESWSNVLGRLTQRYFEYNCNYFNWLRRLKHNKQWQGCLHKKLRSNMKKPLIMVVDDCAMTLDVTRIQLEEAGFEVITRSMPIGTTAEIFRMKPDCVLLDVSMPGLTGDKIVKIVRESDMETKIVLFSAKESNELRELSRECGADGYIKKTNNKIEFINKIQLFVSP